VWCVSHIARGGVVGVRVGGTIRESGTAGMRQRGCRRAGLPTLHLCQATDAFIGDESLFSQFVVPTDLASAWRFRRE
jgi:hypothetical protein